MKPKPIVPDWLVALIAKHHHVYPPELVLSESRARHVVAARHELAFILSDEYGWSSETIAQALGWADHSTALRAIKKGQKWA